VEKRVRGWRIDTKSLRPEEKVEESRRCFKNLTAIHVDTVGKFRSPREQHNKDSLYEKLRATRQTVEDGHMAE